MYSTIPYAIYDDANIHLLVRPSATSDGSPQALPRRTRYGSPEAARYGLVPMADYPDQLIKPADFKEVIRVCHEKKLFPMYHLKEAKVLDPWNQDGLGYCWTFGLTGAVMAARARQGLSPIRLAPTSLGWLVGWQNQGFYLDGAIAGAREKGIAPASHVPELSINPSQFKSGWEQEALKYRPDEIWDVNTSGSVDSLISQILTQLAVGIDQYIAHNYWSHALQICALDWDETKPNNVIWLHWNSHNDGVIGLVGDKGTPDESYGIRTTTLAE